MKSYSPANGLMQLLKCNRRKINLLISGKQRIVYNSFIVVSFTHTYNLLCRSSSIFGLKINPATAFISKLPQVKSN